MASVELDPTFVRSLKLFQSRSKESTEQLRQIYNELVEQRKAEIALKKLNDGEDSQESRASSSGSSRHSRKDGGGSDAKKREAEKEILEKCKQELADLTSGAPPAKRPKTDVTPTSSKNTPERVKNASSDSKESKPRERLREIEEDIFFAPQSQLSTSASRVKEQREREDRERTAAAIAAKLKKDGVKIEVGVLPQIDKKEGVTTGGGAAATSLSSATNSDSDTEVSDNDGGGGGGGDSSMENVDIKEEIGDTPDFSDITCVVCKSFHSTATNILLECQDCHKMCHQECETPPVTDADHRFIWYCSKCSKHMKKITSAAKVVTQKKPAKSTPPSSARDSSGGKSSTRGAATEAAAMPQPFKRLETPKLSTPSKESSGSSTSSGSGSGRVLSGFASLAANLHSGKTDSFSRQASKDSLSGARVARPLDGSSAPHPRTSDTKYAGTSAKVTTSGVGSSSSVVKGEGAGGGPSSAGSILSGSNAAKSSTTGSGASTNRSSSLMSTSTNRTQASSSGGGNGSSSSTLSSSSKMSSQVQSTMMNAADKRLQLMKKKAAKQRVEKRSAKYD